MAENRNYVAVLPDGRETNHTVVWDGNGTWDRGTLRGIAEEAVRRGGLTSPRGQPLRIVQVQVCRLEIRDGKLVRRPPSTFDVTPPLAPLSDADYRREMDEATEGLPDEFKTWVEGEAYDRGHAYGLEEVVSVARGMAYGLKRAVEQYERRAK